MSIGTIFSLFRCSHCHLSNYKCLAVVLNGSIINHHHLDRLDYALRNPSSSTGIFCLNCIANMSLSGKKEECITCKSFSVKTDVKTGRSIFLCNNCMCKHKVCKKTLMYYYLSSNPLPFSNYIGVEFGVNDVLYDSFFQTRLLKQFHCQECGYSEPPALDFYLQRWEHDPIENNTKVIVQKQPVSKLTLEQLSLAKNHDNQQCVVLCDICGRKKTNHDGGFSDVSPIMTRAQTLRYKSFQRSFGKECLFCGLHITSLNGRCFQFDHIDHKTKHLSVYDMIKQDYSDEEIYKELEKCRLLCTNCHHVRSFKQGLYKKWLSHCPPQLKGKKLF